MKKKTVVQSESEKEQMIQDALRTGGYLFPQTVAEVEEFERKFGTTNTLLPEDLKIPHFLEKAKSSKKTNTKHLAVENEHFSMAAREGAPRLPNEILQQMEDDRKKAARKVSNKKAKNK